MAALTKTSVGVFDKDLAAVVAGTCTDGTRTLPMIGVLGADGTLFMPAMADATTKGFVSLVINGAALAFGQGVMTASIPVVLASNQSSIPITIASGGVASGAIASGAVASGAFASGSIAAGAVAAGASSFVKLEDAASANADAGVAVLAVRKATPGNTSDTDGDYEPMQVSAGRLWTSAQVEGNSDSLRVALTVTASAYSAGNVLGGKITLSSAARVAGGSGVIQSFTVQDRSNQKPAMDIFVFSEDPASGTYTDHAAYSWNSTDETKLVGKISIATTDYVTVNSRATATINPGVPFRCTNSQSSLFFIAVVSGTPTPNATTDFAFIVGLLRD